MRIKISLIWRKKIGLAQGKTTNNNQQTTNNKQPNKRGILFLLIHFGWNFLWWITNPVLEQYDLSHSPHLYGRSPAEYIEYIWRYIIISWTQKRKKKNKKTTQLCLRICTLRLDFAANFLLQYSHKNPSPVWRRICSLNECPCVNAVSNIKSNNQKKQSLVFRWRKMQKKQDRLGNPNKYLYNKFHIEMVVHLYVFFIWCIWCLIWVFVCLFPEKTDQILDKIHTLYETIN